MIIKNARIYTPEHTFKTGDLTIRDGRIAFGAPPLEGEEVLDANGAYALPGLVDIHFHGAVGHDFCDADEAGLQAIADFEASKGVLAICPATMTFSEEILNGIMDVAAAHKNGQGADLVGINMEGPYISPKKIGAQNPKYVQGADAAMFRRLQARSGGLIKLVDVAPEEPGNLDFIRDCHNEVCISIAHTCTDYDTAKAAFAAGASHMTHLYNAMPGITHRAPGPIIAALERDAERMRRLSENVEAVAREKEQLAAKSAMHDSLAACITVTKQYLAGDLHGVDGEAVLREWEKSISFREALRLPAKETLYENARSSGVTVRVRGPEPVGAAAELLYAAMQVCLSNAVQYAQATELTAHIWEDGDRYNILLRNNGKPPDKPITEGGGLSNLRRRIERAGGTMTVQSLPVFALVIGLPNQGKSGGETDGWQKYIGR